jgi:hypothetical protein
LSARGAAGAWSSPGRRRMVPVGVRTQIDGERVMSALPPLTIFDFGGGVFGVVGDCWLIA